MILQNPPLKQVSLKPLSLRTRPFRKLAFRAFVLSGAILTFTSTAAHSQANVGEIDMDPAFGTGGMSVLDAGQGSTVATTFTAAKGTRIYVGGTRSGAAGASSVVIARFDTLGAPDPKFGTAGAAIPQWSFSDKLQRMLLLSDNTIVGVGSTSLSTDVVKQGPVLFRLAGNGSPISSFGNGGAALVTYDAQTIGEFRNVDTVSTPAGRAYVATGWIQTGSTPAFFAARVTETGALDPTFGAAGMTKLDALVQNAEGRVLPDGRIMFAGVSTEKMPTLLLALLKQNGTPDSSFGENGVLRTDISMQNARTLTTAISEGKFLVLAAVTGETPFTLLRFNADGSLDQTYGTGGRTVAPVVATMNAAGLVISNDGSALVSGSTMGARPVVAVAKFFKGGAVDTTFGIKGVATLDARPESSTTLIGFNSVGLRRFIAAGTVTTSGQDSMFVARFLPKPASSVRTDAAPMQCQVYPDPVASFLTIDAGEQTLESVQIVDALGRSQLTVSGVPSTALHVDVSSLTSGVYYALVRTDRGLDTRRFTVRR